MQTDNSRRSCERIYSVSIPKIESSELIDRLKSPSGVEESFLDRRDKMQRWRRIKS